MSVKRTKQGNFHSDAFSTHLLDFDSPLQASIVWCLRQPSNFGGWGPLLPPKDQNVLLWLWIKAPFDDCHPCEYSKPQRVVLFWKVNFVTKFMFIPKQSLEVYSGGLYENIIMENMWVEYEIAWQIEFSSSNLYNRIKMIHFGTYISAIWWLQELAFTWLGVSCSVET